MKRQAQAPVPQPASSEPGVKWVAYPHGARLLLTVAHVRSAAYEAAGAL